MSASTITECEYYESPDVEEVEEVQLSKPLTTPPASENSIIHIDHDPQGVFKKFENSNICHDWHSRGKETPTQHYQRLRNEVAEFLDQLARTEIPTEMPILRSNRSDAISGTIKSPIEPDSTNVSELIEKLIELQMQLQSHSKLGGKLDQLQQHFDWSFLRPNMQTKLTGDLVNKIQILESDLSSSNFGKVDETAVDKLLSRRDIKEEQSRAIRLLQLENRLSAMEHLVLTKKQSSDTLTQSAFANPQPRETYSTADQKGLIELVDSLEQRLTLLDDGRLQSLSQRLLELDQLYQTVRDNVQARKDAASTSTLTSAEVHKIDVTFNAVNQIELLVSELPLIVDRLAQLRKLHEHASMFCNNFASLDIQQKDIKNAIKGNNDVLSQLQTNLANNMKTIEGNVLQLEGRIIKISAQIAELRKHE